MSEQWQIALLTMLIGFITMLLGGLAVIAWYKFGQIDGIKEELAETAVRTENRLATMESELRNARHDHDELYRKAEKWFVLTGSKALHSPTNHLQADHELEQFVQEYRAHNHDLPNDVWLRYHGIFRVIMRNESASPNERALAEGLAELCEHKMGATFLSAVKRTVIPE